MKFFVDAPAGLSHAMYRVVDALKKYAPKHVRIVLDEQQADVVLLHVIGYPETMKKVQQLVSAGQQYGLIQYCVRSTQEPSTEKWIGPWQAAHVVWSYYDLPALLAEDKVRAALPSFYMSPLGVDAQTFRPYDVKKKFLIFTSGYVPESEGVLECMEAARRAGGKVFHLGPPDDRYGDHVTCSHGINDTVLAQMYSACTYVAGLRRGEGFELPAAEGLLCGARPVLFDKPHYRQWYEPWGVFISEGSFEEVVESLRLMFEATKTAGVISVSATERDMVVERFDWEAIIQGFWREAAPAPTSLRIVSSEPTKKKLLWVGDAGVSSGFARITHEVCNRLHATWDITVLGVNYFGDPHPYAYSIYPCRTVRGGDAFGFARMKTLVPMVRPDVIVLLTDPWNVPSYLDCAGNVPTVGYLAVDGKNCRGAELNGLRSAVFWTDFGLEEARQGGYIGSAGVIPLGVDLEAFRPIDRDLVRQRMPFRPRDREMLQHAFIVGNVNRNQPRKRLDLTIAHFAEWIREYKVEDAYLYLHVAPTGDMGYDVLQLARYFGIVNRLVVVEPDIGYGVKESDLVETYCTFDVLVSTTQGEGWSLPTMEAMACGIPCIVPDWAALGEWPGNAVLKVACNEIACTPHDINVVGGVVDRDAMILALDQLYRHPEERERLRRLGISHVQQPQYRWDAIASRFNDALEESLTLTKLQAK